MQNITGKCISIGVAVFFATIGVIILILSMILQDDAIWSIAIIMFIFCFICICIANGIDEEENKKKKIYPIKITSNVSHISIV